MHRQFGRIYSSQMMDKTEICYVKYTHELWYSRIKIKLIEIY